MAVPLNTHDFGRFKALADLLKTEGTKGEISIYVGTEGEKEEVYVSLDLKGFVSRDAVVSILND